MKIDKPYFIAEIGLNYDGNLNKAFRMIDEAKVAQADAVKFQSFTVKELLNPLRFKENGDSFPCPFYDDFLRHQLSFKDHEQIASYCSQVEIDFISSAFDLEALTLVGQFCDSIKIASSELNHKDLLLACGAYQKPVFLSMGMGSLQETQTAIEYLKKGGVQDIFVLYCVSLYPLPYEEVNLKVIQTLQEQTHLTVGFSDHSLDDSLAMASIALGGLIIEKHVTLKREDRLFDHSFSMEFQDFAKMIKKGHQIFLALGDGVQRVKEKENLVKKGSRRSFFAMTDIQVGDFLVIGKNIHAVRPLLGIPIEESALFENARAKENIAINHPIYYHMIDKQ